MRNNTIFSSFFFFFFFFLIIYLYFLIPAINDQTFTAARKLVIPQEIPTKEVKAEIETEAVTAEAKLSKCLVQFEYLETFLCLLLIKEEIYNTINSC